MTSPTDTAPITVLRDAVVAANGGHMFSCKIYRKVGNAYCTCGAERNAKTAIAAVFAALREPTVDMETVGARSIRDTMKVENFCERADQCWRAMLAAAERAAADGKGE